MKDFTYRSLGSVSLLLPNTPAARAWVVDYLPKDAQMFGSAIVIEWRYAEDIVNGILDDGLTIEVTR